MLNLGLSSSVLYVIIYKLKYFDQELDYVPDQKIYEKFLVLKVLKIFFNILT